jgi:hypothetical protein
MLLRTQRLLLVALALACAPSAARAESRPSAEPEPAVYLPMVGGPQQPRSYYVDCTAGNDGNSGLGQSQAWRSLAAANRARLSPGDRLLLKRGCTWEGPLNLSWRGTESQPITVDAYGSGYRPIIQNAQYNVVIGGSHLVVQNLATRGRAEGTDPNCQNQPKGWAIGFRFELGSSYNTLRDSEASGHTHGVKVTRGSHHNRIVGNVFADNTLMFILDGSNTNNDAGANGIVLEGDDNVVAHNQIFGHDACSFDYVRDGSAIEVVGGQRNTVHHNVVSNNNTFVELGDSRASDNTFAYNLVTAAVPRAQFLVTEGASGGRGPIYGTRAYNNTVYLTDPTSTGINCDGGCTGEVLRLKNNIIWSEGKIGYIDQRSDEGHNIFWRSDGQPQLFFPTPGDMAGSSKIADPRFVKGSVGGGDFRLQAGSPAIDAGVSDPLGAGYEADLGGTGLYQGAALDIGAYEYRP